jgi:hypothetical protein
MVEEVLAGRGISVTYETVRQWARSSAKRLLIRSATARRLEATNGTWMRSSSRSPGRLTGCSAQSSRMASFSTFWSRAAQRLVKSLLKIRHGAAARDDHRQAPFLCGR